MVLPKLKRLLGGDPNSPSRLRERVATTELTVIALTINRAIRMSQWIPKGFHIGQKPELNKIEALVVDAVGGDPQQAAVTAVEYFYKPPAHYSLHGIFNDFIGDAIKYSGRLLFDRLREREQSLEELRLEPSDVRFEPSDSPLLWADRILREDKGKVLEDVSPSELAAAVDMVLFPLLLCAAGIMQFGPDECYYKVIPAINFLRTAKHLCGPDAQGALEFIESQFSNLLGSKSDDAN